MKMGFYYVAIVCAALSFCGCRHFSDGIVNQTGHTVYLNVAFVDGAINHSLKLSGTNEPTYGFGFAEPAKIQSIEAFTTEHEKIGECFRNKIPLNSREFGENILFAIFDDGIFPVGKSCVKIGSPPQFSEEQVKAVFAKETAR